MTEDFYIKLLEAKLRPNIPTGVLGNYEVALLYLQKFGTGNLPEENWLELNPDAFGVWAQDAEFIVLPSDIPELSSKLPERISGCLHLENSQIFELPKLLEVGGYLDLSNSQIQELPKLERVGGYLDLGNSQIKELPNLKRVLGDLDLRNSKIQEMPKLSEVEGPIYAEEKLDYWKDYFNKTGRPHLAEKVEIW
jgi:hypothetical protein